MIDGTTANPFVGLRPFCSGESLLFFGRRQQVTELLKELYRTHFLAVVGSSGCGKSSLIQAGLIPRLTAGFLVENRDLWIFRTITPGDAPRARLAAAFDVPESAVRDQGASALIAQLMGQPDASSRNCFLLIDQFEEIFADIASAPTRDEAADFVGILLALAAQREFPVFVVLTMRSDFLGDCDVFHGLPEAINQSHYLVPRLTRPYRQEAIQGPVRLFGRTITPQLVDCVLNDLGDDQDQLPIMQHALLRTWEGWQRNGGNGPIDVSHYQAIGGVKDALSRDAEAALQEVPEEERQLAIRIFQALTDTDESNRPVRRYAQLSELERETGASRAAILQALEPFRGSGRSFVVLRQAPDSSDATVFVSHESLIRQWPSLRDWVDQERQSRDHYLRLVDLAERHARGEEGLLRDPGLQLALDWRDNEKPSEAWAKRYRDRFDLAMAFLNRSNDQREKERGEREAQRQVQLALAAEQGRSKARSVLLRWAVGFGIVGFAAAAAAIYQSINAERQRILADSGRLALHARMSVERNLDLAMLWSVEALRQGQTFESRSGLLSLVGRQPHPSTFLHGHTGYVQAVAFAPDGKLAASSGADGKIVLWNAETNQSRSLVERDNEAQAVAFSPDGLLFAAEVKSGTVTLWDAATWQIAHELILGDDRVRSLAFSRDGKRLVAGSLNGAIVLWTLPGPAQTAAAGALAPRIISPATNTHRVESVVFSPAANLLGAGSSNGSVTIWQLDGAPKSRVLGKHGAAVSSLAFGFDGDVLVSGSDDRTIRIWSLRDDGATTPLQTIAGQAAVRCVAVSSDSRLLASGDNNGTIRLWDLEHDDRHRSRVVERVVPLRGHGAQVRSIDFSPDASRLVSGGWDSKVILWDVGRETLVEGMIRDDKAKSIDGLAWTPDRKSVVWVGDDRRVGRWNLETRQHEPIQQNPEAAGWAAAVFFDRSGRLLRGGIDNTGHSVRVWDVEAGSIVGTPVQLSKDEEPVVVTVSPDRRLVAYETAQNDLVVWDLSAGRRLPAFANKKARAEDLAFNHDGTILAGSEGTAVILWSLETGEELDRLTDRAVEGTLRSLAFSPDGSRLAVGSLMDRQIFVWDLRARRLLGVLWTGHRGVVQTVAFSPDNERLASGDGSDGTIRVWNLGVDALTRYACRTANGQLPRDEWSRILPRTPYHETCGREQALVVITQKVGY